MNTDPTRERILHGLITLYILKELVKRPMHGYELQKSMYETTGQSLPQGSIYILLKSMKEKGYVTAESAVNDKGQQLTIYHITEEGKKFLCNHSEALLLARKIIDDLLSTVNLIEYKN
ncbi:MULTISPECIES: PadR family transcriptional regulator [unclassified Thermoplasma]|uniref:PadR family transcriptional regulator n=1 Tax=unclassified Thermoplasma TaxID=2684908 RepID=UPI000D84EBFE|nr:MULTISPECIES: PadR family transcriptional regulator [unclassified Thermoplasma]PYB68839.1 PadR family transcriptional regulator [Thermoplasma sp. Kam2015]